MHVELHPRYANTTAGKRAKELTSACVHCGFCLATCPTYLDSRDERDSPRGRIYLIKQLLETGAASEQTQTHLDRCLTCRSCETTCPS
ncbi:MAG: 4Fe-4S dicluster domain-containing protein, partial [Halioglobus sp.]